MKFRTPNRAAASLLAPLNQGLFSRRCSSFFLYPFPVPFLLFNGQCSTCFRCFLAVSTRTLTSCWSTHLFDRRLHDGYRLGHHIVLGSTGNQISLVLLSVRSDSTGFAPFTPLLARTTQLSPSLRPNASTHDQLIKTQYSFRLYGVSFSWAFRTYCHSLTTTLPFIAPPKIALFCHFGSGQLAFINVLQSIRLQVGEPMWFLPVDEGWHPYSR